MEYKLLENIGYVVKDTIVVIDDGIFKLEIDKLVGFKFIEEVQEPIWTDKDILEFACHIENEKDCGLEYCLSTFKQKKGKGL